MTVSPRPPAWHWLTAGAVALTLAGGALWRVLDVPDDDKLDAYAAVAPALERGAAAGQLLLEPAVVHACTVYGQLRQAGQDHAAAAATVADIAEDWAAGGAGSMPPTIRPLGDDEILALLRGVEHVTPGDWGGRCDLGYQYGSRRQAGQTVDQARHEAGAWLAHWYGGENPWERPRPTAPAVLRLVDGVAFADDRGLVLPTYAHAGDLFSVYVREPARARQQLDAVAAAGYRGLRVWLTLGCGPETAAGCRPGDYWHRREVGPDVTPDYWARLEAFRDELLARGLRLVGSQGDITQIRDRRAYMAQLAAVDAVSFLDVIDGGNEAWQTGEPDPARLAAFVRAYADAGGRALKTLTDAPLYSPGAPPPAEQFDRFSIPPADLFDVHGFRGGRSWDKRRHYWGYTYCGEGCPRLKVGINSEPAGGGARVTAIENRHELDDEAVALLALGSHLGRQAFVWFSGEGVILERGLEGEPGFASVPKAVARLPQDLYRFGLSLHSGPTFRTSRVLEATGEVRIDGRLAGDGRFAFTVDGPAGSYALRVARGFTGQLCHPGTDVCEDVTARAGDELRVAFTRGRLLVGRLQ